METRKPSSTLDGQRYFVAFLELSHCTNVKIEVVNLDQKVCYLCGFSSDNTNICSILSSKFPGCQFNCEGENYIVSVETKVVRHELSCFFEQTLNTVFAVGLHLPHYGEYKANTFCLNQPVQVNQHPRFHQSLADAGFELRTEEASFDGVCYRESRVTIVIDRFTDFKKFICTGLKRANTSFLQAKATFFSNRDMPKQGNPDVLHSHVEEQKKIIKRINALVFEMRFSCFKTSKIQKIEFLNLLLSYQRVNPALSLKTCIEFAKKNKPDLYEQAISGDVWARTRKLLDEISSLKEPVSRSTVELMPCVVK